jgi:hypothetical protein
VYNKKPRAGQTTPFTVRLDRQVFLAVRHITLYFSASYSSETLLFIPLNNSSLDKDRFPNYFSHFAGLSLELENNGW